MPELTEWLQLMLAEIVRKREDAERAQDEDAKRQTEQAGVAQAPAPRHG